MPSGITSYFAPVERDDDRTVRSELELIMDNPVMDTLLSSIGGLVAVLNDKRQILMVNQTLLNQLGIRDIDCILGRRLGEAAECIHAHDMKGGCGTGPYCVTCGAVIAMEAARMEQKPFETKCYIEKDDSGQSVDLSFSVRTSPVRIEGMDLILIILRDISSEERWSILERTFFHDLNNIIGSLTGSMEMMKLGSRGKKSREVQRLQSSAQRLVEEVAVHRVLCEDEGYRELTSREYFPVDELIGALKLQYLSHPVGQGKTLDIGRHDRNRMIYSNKTLILRVLGNMLTNAFEATEKEGRILLTTEDRGEAVLFSVWNAQDIPDKIALRVFQRNYSTKAKSGRGLGTFGMKLFGERILGGKVEFSSSSEEGTTFRFILPLNTSDGDSNNN